MRYEQTRRIRVHLRIGGSGRLTTIESYYTNYFQELGEP
jgi:hypothetical protein